MTQPCHTTDMTPSDRDRYIIRLADYFGEISASQVRSIAFPDARSRTSCDRALTRLVADGYLARVEKRRSVGGARGGSGEYVYQLGTAGWLLCKREGRYNRKAVDYHALAIVDAYIRLLGGVRAGAFTLDGFTPEPECHMTVDGNELRPDLFIELSRPSGATLSAWVEIDLGTERQARISEKIQRYIKAYACGKVDPFPRVVFVAHDDERAREIAWIASKLPVEEARLFQSLSISEFPQSL